MWWSRGDRAERDQQQLIAMLQQDLDARARETERLHTLLEQEQMHVTSLTKQLQNTSPQVVVIHDYASQLITIIPALAAFIWLGWTQYRDRVSAVWTGVVFVLLILLALRIRWVVDNAPDNQEGTDAVLADWPCRIMIGLFFVGGITDMVLMATGAWVK